MSATYYYKTPEYVVTFFDLWINYEVQFYLEQICVYMFPLVCKQARS